MSAVVVVVVTIIIVVFVIVVLSFYILRPVYLSSQFSIGFTVKETGAG